MTIHINGRASTDKIDSLATIGLLGVSNSLAYYVHAIEKHVHSPQRWLGMSADQSGTDWAIAAGLTAFQAISGASVFGVDANDEAKVLGTSDTPVIAGMVTFDAHMLLIKELSVDVPYTLRMVYGSDTMANEEAAGNYSDVMLHNIVTGSKSGGVPIPVMMPRLNCGIDKLWIRAKCATDNATADFFIGLHAYVG